MQKAKRTRREVDRLTQCTTTKIGDCKWPVLYWALALECDTPILEALVQSTYAFAAVNLGRPDMFMFMLQKYFLEPLYSAYPAWHESHSKYGQVGLTFLRLPNERRCFELCIDRKPNHVDNCNFQIRIDPVNPELFICFDVSVRTAENFLYIALDRETTWRRVKVAEFASLLEQQLARFETIFSQNATTETH